MDGLRKIENKKLSYAEVVKQSHEQLVHQANELPVELTNTTNLQHLNDDCLLEIFSVKSLDLLDLCSLAETCTRFQSITQRVFPKDLSIQIGRDDYKFKTKNYPFERRHDIERLFKNFGSILYEIKIASYEIFVRYSCDAMMLFLLNLLTEYRVDTFKVLKIYRITISEVLTVKFNAMFQRLQKLNLNSFCIEDDGDDKTLFAGCGSLIKLSVVQVESSAFLENTFPKLERLTYFGIAEPTTQLLSTFISRHPRLKMLHLRFKRIENESFKNVVEEIGNSCKELEELTIGLWCKTPSSIQALQAVKSLKTLKLWQVSCNDFKFMSALTNLRELHLLLYRLPEDVNQFAFLTQLTKLHFLYSKLGSLDVVEIIRRLKNLEEMTIRTRTFFWKRDDFVLDEKTFSKILAVVRGRPKVLTLKCDFDFKNCDENQKVRLVPI